MDPFLGIMFVLWVIKVLAEDGYSTYKGTSNPRMDRRKARQKSRAGNPIWTQFVGWLGDVAEDAREEQGRARQEKRERQAEERRKRELAEHETVDADYQINEPGGPGAAEGAVPDDDVIDMATPRPRKSLWDHEDLEPEDVDDCNIPGCPVHHPVTPEPQQTQPDPTPYTNPYSGSEGAAMAIEIKGLDPAIDYAKEVASSHGEHGTAGNEGYLGALSAANVTGASYTSAAEAQEASSIAAAKWEAHGNLLAEHKRVQEAQDQVPDAGTQEFNQGGR